jgi:hypothetical protein
VTRRALLLALLALGAARAPARPAAAQGAPAPGPAPALPRLRVEGKHIVGAGGRPVVLRGVSFSDPDRLEKAGRWTRAYFEAARAWNANVVRLPVHPQAWRARGAEAYLRLVDDGVRWAAELGMYVILDWHSIGELRTGRYQRDIYVTTRAETEAFWRAAAARYGRDPTVAFYELFNEPATLGAPADRAAWEAHRRTMEALIAAIRAEGAAGIPLVAGFDWAYDLTPVRDAPVRAGGVAYVSHPYPQKRPAPWPAQWERDWGFVADRYPVVATELGFMQAGERGAHVPVLGDEAYGRAVVDYFSRRGVSWTAWVFDPDWSPQLLADWEFRPTRQGVFFRDALRRLNAPAAPAPAGAPGPAREAGRARARLRLPGHRAAGVDQPVPLRAAPVGPERAARLQAGAHLVARERRVGLPHERRDAGHHRRRVGAAADGGHLAGQAPRRGHVEEGGELHVAAAVDAARHAPVG